MGIFWGENVGGGETGSAEAWRSRKAREVLVALALAGPRGHHRDQVIKAVWPGREPGKGRILLRTALAEAVATADQDEAPAPARVAAVEQVLRAEPWRQEVATAAATVVEGAGDIAEAAPPPPDPGDVRSGRADQGPPAPTAVS